MTTWLEDVERVVAFGCGAPARIDEARWSLLARWFYDRWIREQLVPPRVIAHRPDLVAKWQRRAALWRKSAAAAVALRSSELGYDTETVAWVERMERLPGPMPPKEVIHEVMEMLERLERIAAVSGEFAQGA